MPARSSSVAWNSALIYDMIFTQPVYYKFKDLPDWLASKQ